MSQMMVLIRRLEEKAMNLSDAAADFTPVDALTMWMVKNPRDFDVIVASSLFGDISTDLEAKRMLLEHLELNTESERLGAAVRRLLADGIPA